LAQELIETQSPSVVVSVNPTLKSPTAAVSAIAG
jgi:hypothetical protein